LWIVEFKEYTVQNSIKMVVTTSPSSTTAFSYFTGMWLVATNLGVVSAIYYKGAGDTLVNADYAIDPNTDPYP
jgi:hypothetical protein